MLWLVQTNVDVPLFYFSSLFSVLLLNGETSFHFFLSFFFAISFSNSFACRAQPVCSKLQSSLSRGRGARSPHNIFVADGFGRAAAEMHGWLESVCVYRYEHDHSEMTESAMVAAG